MNRFPFSASKVMLLVAWGMTVSFGLQQVSAQNYKNNPEEPWNRYLADKTLRLSEQTASDLDAVTKENWEATKSVWRTELQDMLGLSPWPERGPLNTEIVRWTDFENIRVGNLVFEPSPGLYATANLYLPTGKTPDGGWPAVVYVCGHARADEFGRLMGNKTGYQHHGLWLAKHGYACIIVDTVQLGEFQGEHHGTFSQGRWDWISKGYTPAGVEAWIAIRSLELLQQRDDINPEKIGLTGRSGGGAYSWYAAALDERFKAIVPVAGITDLQDHVIDGCIEGHCDCMFMVNKYEWDFGKLAALIAPRPLLLTNTDSDTIFPLTGVLRIHNQLQRLYTRLGAPTNYGLLIAPGPHKDVQELQVGAFKWLSKHLTGNELVVDSAAEKSLEPASMVAFPSEMPLNENVTNLSSWFTRERESSMELWKREGNSWLERVLATDSGQVTAPNLQSPDSKIDRQPVREIRGEGQVKDLQWELVQLSDPNDWHRGWIRVRGMSIQDEGALDDGAEPKEGVVKSPSETSSAVVSVSPSAIFHVGAWRGEKLSFKGLTDNPQVLEQWLSKGQIANAIHSNPNAYHYFILPRGFDLEKQVSDIRELNHLHRRFYLLGDSLEQLQLRDEWTAMESILSEQGRDQKVASIQYSIAGYNRSGISAGLLTWKALHHGVDFPKPRNLQLDNVSNDSRLYACLPSFEQMWNVEDVFAAISERVALGSSHSQLDIHKLHAIDNRDFPELATGARVQLIGSDKARIISRTTRWSLPNLGDLNNYNRNSGLGNSTDKLPQDSLAGMSFAVPGIEAELRFRWRKAGEANWTQGDWIETEADNDYEASQEIEGLTESSKVDYQVETRAKGGAKTTATFSGSFHSFPSELSAAPIRIAIGMRPQFSERDGTFGFDALRAMQRRSTSYLVLADSKKSVSLNPEKPDQAVRNDDAVLERQRLLGLKSVLEANRRMAEISIADLVKNLSAGAPEESASSNSILATSVPLAGKGELWILQSGADYATDYARMQESILASKASVKLVLVFGDIQSDRLRSLTAQSNVGVILLNGASNSLEPLDAPQNAAIKLVVAEPFSGLSVGPMSLGRAKQDGGAGAVRDAPTDSNSVGYIEIEIPGSTSRAEGSDEKSDVWIIRSLDQHGNEKFKRILNASN